MNIKTLSLVSILLLGTVILVGCGSSNEENVWLANPASVYCEDNWWTLEIENSDEWSVWICRFDDWSYCEEWSYYRGECIEGDIIYNTIWDDEVIIDETPLVVSEKYSDEELISAASVINDVVTNQFTVPIEFKDLSYAWDEVSNNECSNYEEYDDCVVFVSNIHIPDVDVEMAWAFEPNTDIDWYGWTLGRKAWGQWEAITWWLW